MKKINDLLEKRWVSNCIAVGFGILFYLILSNVTSIFSKISSFFQLMSPIMIGIVLAYLMHPVVNFFSTRIFKSVKKENSRNNLSVVMTIILILIVITLFFVKVIPSLMSSMTGLISNVDIYKRTIEDLLERINSLELGFHVDITMLTGNLDTWLDTMLEKLEDNINVIIDASKTMGNAVLNWVIGFILAIYFLVGKKEILNGIDEFRRSLLSEETYKKHNVFWKRCNEILVQYIGCSFADGLIVGLVNAFVMLILKMPYVALVSIVVGVTNLLPTFGPIIGGAIGAFILVINKPIYALWFLITALVLQTIDGYILKPKLFGGSLGIPAVVTLIAIIAGGKFFGVLGIFLAIPFAAVMTFTYKESVLPFLNERKNNQKSPPLIEMTENVKDNKEEDLIEEKESKPKNTPQKKTNKHKKDGH